MDEIKISTVHFQRQCIDHEFSNLRREFDTINKDEFKNMIYQIILKTITINYYSDWVNVLQVSPINISVDVKPECPKWFEYLLIRLDFIPRPILAELEFDISFPGIMQ